MRSYQNKAMGQLARELTAGLLRLRKGYVDAAEELAQRLKSDQEYPFEYVVYRLTGYRPAASERPRQPPTGRSLRSDLLRLMLDLCDSFELRTSDYKDRVYDSPALAKHFQVSTKTVQRWRRRGLPARRLVFPDGKKRIAFLERSVLAFARSHRRLVKRSMKFSQLTEEEREEIIRRAKRMARFANCTLSDAAKRLAGRMGRAVETIRYTIRKHDREHPEQAVFPHMSEPLTEQEKAGVYRGFLGDDSVADLAKRFKRTRGSIYRIVNEMRARQLLHRPISYVYNPQFDLPNADEIILGPSREGTWVSDAGDSAPARRRKRPKVPADLPPYLKALYEVPLLSAEQERDLFRRYNYYKYKADKLRRQIDLNRVRTSQLREIESLLLQANVVKNRIIRANLRLVVSIAKKHLGGPQGLFELISDGNVALMRAVEKFDYSRGFRFSTYASWAIMRNFARSVPRERYQLDRFATGHDEILDIAATMRTYDPNEVNLPELRESIDAMLAQLTPRERTILIDHYGLDESGDAKTFDQLGHRLGISKERVRQIELQALKKLRRIMRPRRADLLS
jgi:RNA polymerase sigma factor (sigma-70 family)